MDIHCYKLYILYNNYISCSKWSDLTFDPKLLQNITKAGYIRPRPIQGAVIPLVFEGITF